MTFAARSRFGVVASADGLASQAGAHALACGGNAVDAAIATSAAMAVVAPHLCGMGGDLFALVHVNGEVFALDAAGRAGSGVSSEGLRADGFREMPFHGDLRSVTVPGAVAGWIELHRRFGVLPLSQVFESAVRLAEDGFPASPLLVGSLSVMKDSYKPNFHELNSQATHNHALVRREGVGRTLRSIATGGAAAFYLGEFGNGLLTMGNGLYSPEDLANASADWVTPLSLTVHGHRVFSIPAPSQGYLFLAALGACAAIDLPDDPDDPMWAHLLIEATTAVSHDRPTVLHDRADLAAALPMLIDRASLIDPSLASVRPTPGTDGDTTYLCSVDASGMGVSLINSNASGFGSLLVEPSTGINLHNRGLGFSVETGHPAEVAAGRKPPHTLCPSLVTTVEGRLVSVLGTMGGDAQPQIMLQMITRLLRHGAVTSPADAVDAGRFALRGPVTGFDSWTSGKPPTVQVEGHAPENWTNALAERGHAVELRGAFDSSFGHAHCIVVRDDGVILGAADRRSVVGSCVGL
jgi:gamma-glutamyltranspeptidase/glutathione hydrolase